MNTGTAEWTDAQRVCGKKASSSLLATSFRSPPSVARARARDKGLPLPARVSAPDRCGEALGKKTRNIKAAATVEKHAITLGSKKNMQCKKLVFVSHTIYCQYERGPSAATLQLKCDPDCDGDLPVLQNLHDMVTTIPRRYGPLK